MSIALVVVAVLLLLGIVVRQKINLLRTLFIPASVVAGFIGLLGIQLCLGFGEHHVVSEWAATISKTLAGWPGWLIAVVFAGMLLERKQVQSSVKESAKRVGKQGLMVWVIVLGQTAVGLLATWLIIQNWYDVPNSFGMLIETGFAGGHGTAAAMGEVFAHPSVNLVGGKDLGMLMATFGLVYGVVTGIFWINIGVRSGWVAKSKNADKVEGQLGHDSIGAARIDLETIDPLLFQVVWLTLAFGIGLAMQSVVMQFAQLLDGYFLESVETDRARAQLSKELKFSSIADFPLFIYTLFGGLIVRKLLTVFGQAQRIDNATIGRLTSTAMDILVVAAIASLNLQAVAAMVIPLSVLCIAGAIWTAICLLVISRWLLPREHWFQLGLINYGMSTGTTATGFVLLRMIDPDLDSGAAADYALAAPLSAPFVGGGMLTIGLPLLLLERVSIAIPALVLLSAVIWLVLIGYLFNKDWSHSK